jgi:hypothetical protein
MVALVDLLVIEGSRGRAATQMTDVENYRLSWTRG